MKFLVSEDDNVKFREILINKFKNIYRNLVLV